MVNRQRKLADFLGNDTHTRNVGNNLFQSQSVDTNKIMTGEIFLAQPEPLFQQTGVTVNLTKGGMLTGVPYPNAFIDPISGNMHGLYEGPIPGQMVGVGFVEGNSAAPIIVNRYPYQGVGNTFTEPSYILPLTQSLYNSTDIILGHFTGSYLSFNTGVPIPTGELPGSVTLSALTDLSLAAAIGAVDISSFLNMSLSSTMGVTIDGLTTDISATLALTLNSDTVIELNGNTKQFVTWVELNAALTAFIAQLTTAMTTTFIAGNGAAQAAWIGFPLTLDISSAMTTTVLTGG